MADSPALQAVILAGGQGTRLRPLTLARAKPVVPLLNRPFLAYQLALLRAHGVSDVVLACSYRVEDVRAALGEAEHLGVRLRYVIEDEPLGTGGGVRNASVHVSRTLSLLTCDILTHPELTEMRRLHATRGSRTTIYLQPVPDPRQYGLVETEADGRLKAFREKPSAEEEITTNTINAGIYLIDADLLGRIPRERASSIEREFFPALIADGVPCFGWCPTAYWRDIGNPAAYRAAQIDLLQGRAAMPLAPPGQRRDGSWGDGGGIVEPGARIVAPSVVGAGVVLGPRCKVGPGTVIGEGARIGPDARVQGAILWGRVDAAPGAVLRVGVLGADLRIGEGARVGPEVVLASGTIVPERATLTR